VESIFLSQGVPRVLEFFVMGPIKEALKNQKGQSKRPLMYQNSLLWANQKRPFEKKKD
jgi:hypothetical protein